MDGSDRIQLAMRRECIASTPFLAAACEDAQPDPTLRFAGPLVLYAPAERFDGSVVAMGMALPRLLEPLGARTLTFLHASPLGRWPTRRRTPPVLADSARAFRAMGAGKVFGGGIRVAVADAAAVVAPLMWTMRMDAGYGPVYFATDGAPLVASFCQHGNLHLDIYDPDVLGALRESAPSAGLEEAIDGVCRERFATDGAIPGRRLVMTRGR